MKREKHELCPSPIGFDEIAADEHEMALRRLELLAGITVLDLTAAAETLADGVLHSGLLPAAAESCCVLEPA